MKITFTLKAALLSAAAFSMVACATDPGASQPPSSSLPNSHLYTQTNETDNKIIHYVRRDDGTLVEVERVPTGGKGSSGYKVFTGQKSAPDNLVSAGAVILSADHKMLFAVNVIDRSVSSFAVGNDGRLQLRDHQPTGEKGPPTSLAYNNKARMLYVMHTTGPNHIRAFKVVDGKLAATGTAYTLNTGKFNDRVATQIIASPDDRFLLANVIFNSGPPRLEPANDKTKDGLMVFPFNPDGSLGKAVLNDAGGAGPFALAFLNGSNTTFVNTLALGSGAVLGTLGPDGKVTNAPTVKVDLSRAPKGPAETCWVSLSPDNRYAYVSNFGFGTLTSFEISNGKISVAADDLGFVPGDGKYKGVAGVVTSGPVDSWASKDGYLYQIYPNARQLVAYKLNGPQLERIASYPVPYDSTVGLAGY